MRGCGDAKRAQDTLAREAGYEGTEPWGFTRRRGQLPEHAGNRTMLLLALQRREPGFHRINRKPPDGLRASGEMFRQIIERLLGLWMERSRASAHRSRPRERFSAFSGRCPRLRVKLRIRCHKNSN